VQLVFRPFDPIRWSLWAGLCVAALGCGRSNVDRLPVFGLVVGPGSEKLTGSISFIPDKNWSSSGSVASLINGQYRFDRTNGPRARTPPSSHPAHRDEDSGKPNFEARTCLDESGHRRPRRDRGMELHTRYRGQGTLRAGLRAELSFRPWLAECSVPYPGTIARHSWCRNGYQAARTARHPARPVVRRLNARPS
jgi:hypothetical protein